MKININRFGTSGDLNITPNLKLTKPNLNDKYDISIQNSNMDKIDTILDLVYPIGRGFIDFTNTDFSNYLGFTWERTLVGLTPVGLDTSQTEFNTIGKQGGEKTHKLIVNEIPSHSHESKMRYIYCTKGDSDYWTVPYSSGDKASMNTNNTGGDQPHNNLQPYEVVAYWKRIK